MKRKLFIGSSTEGQTIANKVKDAINNACGDWIQAETWSDGNVFALNNSALHSLVTASRKFDYGILIATKDDFLKSRGAEHFVPRDNVMFEMGMFLGSLGLTRAFLMVEAHAKLPTDYSGVTVSYFDPAGAGSIESAIEQIIKSLSNSRDTFNLKPAPSAALALGYFNNFIQPLAKVRHEAGAKFNLQILLPANIKDIKTEINAYKNSHESVEISVYNDQKRPIVYEYKSKPTNYWDIPSTLGTLRQLIDILQPSHEIGVDKNKMEWLNHEVRNFAGTIKMLVNDCAACKGSVEVIYL